MDPNPMTERGHRLNDTMRHTVFMDSDLWDRLHAIAARYGFRNHSGRKVGQGNVTRLLNEVAEGKLAITEVPDEDAT
jgi:hypothetical protein